MFIGGDFNGHIGRKGMGMRWYMVALGMESKIVEGVDLGLCGRI